MNILSELLNFTGENLGIIEVTASNISSFPVTITDDRILARHKCVGYFCSSRAILQRDLEVETSDGQAVIKAYQNMSDAIWSGNSIGTMTLYLALQTNGASENHTTRIQNPRIPSSKQYYEVTVTSLAANTYLGQAIDVGRHGDKLPILTGYDITGTNSSRLSVMGAYVYYDGSTNYAYIKMRNTSDSAITNFKVQAHIIWI